MTSVLIIGAGPVGLSMALFLKHYQINCRIIDQKAGPTQTSNAIMVNSRTLEIFDVLGLAPAMIEQGLKIDGANYYSGTAKLAQLSFKSLNSRFHFGLALPQAETEQFLTEQLKIKGIEIEWNTKVTSLSQNATGVSVICDTIAGQSEIAADWCVACDGYKGIVREQIKISRGCHDLEQHFFMADVEFTSFLPPSHVVAVFDTRGTLLFIPMRHATRIVAEISQDPQFKNASLNDEKTFKTILQQRYPAATIQKIDWLSSFWVHECLAQHYRQNRVFLAGDAAHTHSPAGGQGMNTGIQDVWNLAWKLAWVIQGKATSALLDSYELERRPIAEHVLKGSGYLTQIATSTNSIVIWLRNKLLPLFIKHFPIISKKMVNNLMQTNIRYRSAPLTQSNHISAVGMKNDHVDNQGRFTLLLALDHLSQAEKELHDYQSILNIKVDENFSLDSNEKPYWLIRPDGYVAAIYKNLAEVRLYFENII